MPGRPVEERRRSTLCLHDGRGTHEPQSVAAIERIAGEAPDSRCSRHAHHARRGRDHDHVRSRAGRSGIVESNFSITGEYAGGDRASRVHVPRPDDGPLRDRDDPRLVQSFTGGLLGSQGFTDSETYDDALIIDSFLAEGTPDGLNRAETIGSGLLYVQSNDRKADGRIRAAYAPSPLTKRRFAKPTDKTSDVGNMAWVGMALVRLSVASGNPAYLIGAESIGNWIVRNTWDIRSSSWCRLVVRSVSVR